jgi:hypothetical protein
MKKTFTLFTYLIILLMPSVSNLFAIEAVDPNTRTGWPSPYPLGEILFNENFKDWPNTRTFSSNPVDCNLNDRTTNFNWQNLRVHRASGESGCLLNLYLISAEIQPFCDTQSGTTFLTDTTINTSTKLGRSNPGVSIGNITLLDSANVFVNDPATGLRRRRGALIVGMLPSITLIQYTTSSYGAKRGFTLEYSIDHGLNWIILRKEHGKSNDTTMTTSGYQLANSPKGVIWEEQVDLADAMLRFTINANQPQIVRIHDLRIFGSSPIREDGDDRDYEAISQIEWGDWLGVNRPTADPSHITFSNNILRISGNPVWTKVINLTGQNVRTFANEQLINLSDLCQGVYLIQSKDQNNRISRSKIKI